MRKALLVLAAGLVAGTIAEANEATWKWDGQIRTRFNYQDNTDLNADANDQTNDFQQRNKVGMTVAKGEKLMGRISLINHYQWGNTLPSAREASGNTQAANDEQVGIHEAYIWWKASDMVSVMSGRIAQQVADGSVISKFDYAQHPYAFDGVGVKFDLDFGSIGTFGVKGEDNGGTSPASSDPESVYYGLTFDMKNLPDALSTVHAHYLLINQDPETANATSLRGARYGLTVGGAVSGFDFKGTYAAIDGDLRNNDGDADTDNAFSASMYDIAAGYTLANVMNLRFGLTYHSDTGNDAEATSDDNEFSRYDGFYYDQHAYAGLMDLFEFGNLTYTGVTVTIEPSEGLTAGLGYYMFSNTSADDYGVAYTDLRMTTATPTEEIETELGNEIDVWVTKAYEGGFSINARYGQFTPGAYFDETNDAELTDTHTKFVVTGMLDF